MGLKPVFRRAATALAARLPARLSSRLLWALLPVILSAAALIAVSSYLIARAALVRGAEQELSVLTELAVTHAAAFVAQRDADLAAIAQSPLFKDYAANARYGLGEEAEVYRREVERMLADFSARAGVYARLRFLDTAGREVCVVRDGRVERPRRAADPGDLRLTLALAPGRRHTTGLAAAAWRVGPVVTVWQGLYDEAGRPVGVLAFDYTLDSVRAVLGRLRVGESGTSELLGLGEARAPAPEGTLAAVRPVPGTPWAVRMAVRRAELLSRLRWVGVWSLLFAAATVLLVAAIVSGLVRSLLRPIAALSAAADSYARGELAVRVVATGASETAGLAASFNSMADSLEERTRDLEQRVRELSALTRMHDAVLRRLERRETGRVCLEASAAGLGFARGALFWVDARAGEAVGGAGLGFEAVAFSDAELRAWRIPLDGPDPVAESVRRGAPVFVADPQSDPRCDRERAARLRAGGFWAVPVVSGGEPAAVLCLSDPGRDAPGPEAVRPGLALFAGAAGLALSNARLTEALTESEARYRTAVENSPDAVIGLDQSYRVTLWNRRAEALFGRQPAEAYGRTLDWVLGKEDYASLRRRVETAGAVRQAECKGRTADGRELDLSVSWAGREGAPGAREWFVVIQDVTEKKRLQARLIHAEKLTAVGSMLAGVVHEIHRPMTVVIGYLEMIVASLPAGRDREDLGLAFSHALRCKDITHGLLVYTHQRPPERKRLPLNAAARAALTLMEYRLNREHAAKVELALDAAEPETAGDTLHLQQALINLMNNSLDAFAGRPGRVRLETGRDGAAVWVCVTDDGPGVPTEARRRLFQPFYTTKPIGKGTGLGLSMAQETAQEMGGSLRYEEAPGGGARFVMTLPSCPDGVEAAPPPKDLPAPVPGLRALAVDDDPETAHLMARLLREDGLEAEAAGDSEDAAALLARGAYDLVVTDAEMRGLRGPDLVRAGRALPRPPAFLVVSGDIMNPALRAETDRLGVPVLAKPFLRSDFVRLVRRLLKGRVAADGRP